MIFSLCVIAVFVVASIYFYFKAEGLHRQLVGLRKDLNNAKKESKVLVEAITLIARKNEESLKARVKEAQESGASDELVDMFYPFTNNYAAIFCETWKGKGQMHKAAQKCFESYQKGSYRKFTGYIGTLDAHVKRAWASNNLVGLMTFSEAIIFHLESKLDQAS